MQHPHPTKPLKQHDFIYLSILEHQGKDEAEAYLARQKATADNKVASTASPSEDTQSLSSSVFSSELEYRPWSYDATHLEASEDALGGLVIRTLIEQPDQARESTERLIACTKKELSRGAYRTYHLLHQVASIVALQRDYHRGATTVSFFCPMDVIALARVCCRSTIWRHCQELQELGYIDKRSHKTTHNGKNINDGTVWNIKMQPHSNYHAKLRYDEINAKYRDLTTDIENGKTAYADIQNADSEKMQQSKELLNNYVFNVDIVIRWTFNPNTEKTPVIFDCCKTRSYALEGVLDVFNAEKSQRTQMVDYAAKAIMHKIQDGKGLGFYRKLIWNMLRSCDQQIHNSSIFERLYNEVKRVTVDIKEGFARNGAALLISRIKQWHDYQQIMDVAQTRVGVVSIAA